MTDNQYITLSFQLHYYRLQSRDQIFVAFPSRITIREFVLISRGEIGRVLVSDLLVSHFFADTLRTGVDNCNVYLSSIIDIVSAPLTSSVSSYRVDLVERFPPFLRSVHVARRLYRPLQPAGPHSQPLQSVEFMLRYLPPLSSPPFRTPRLPVYPGQ